MNKHILLLLINYLAIITVQGDNPDLLKQFTEKSQKCANMYDVNTEKVAPFLIDSDATITENQKCFITCLIDEFELLKNGKLDKGVSKSLAKTWFGDKTEGYSNMKIVIDVCHSKVTANPEDTCAIGGLLRQCALNLKSQANGFLQRQGLSSKSSNII